MGDARKHPRLPVNADALSPTPQPSSSHALSSKEGLSDTASAQKIENTTSHEVSAVQLPTTHDIPPALTEVQPPKHGEQIDASESQDMQSLTQPGGGQSQSIRNGDDISTSNGEQTSMNVGPVTAGEALASSSQHVPYISYPDIELDSNVRISSRKAHDSSLSREFEATSRHFRCRLSDRFNARVRSLNFPFARSC